MRTDDAMVANELARTVLFLANCMLPSTEAADQAGQFFKLPKKALIVASSYIGDNILLLPFIAQLRRHMGPFAHLDLVTTRELFPLYETVSELSALYREKVGTLKHPRLFLKSGQYDTVFFCRYSPVWATAAVAAEVPQRVGFDLERLGLRGLKQWGSCLTHSIPSTDIFDPRRQADVYLDMLRHPGLEAQASPLEYRSTARDHAVAEGLLADLPKEAPRILIQASCRSPGKAWPQEYWMRLLEGLSREYKPVLVATGTVKEAAEYEPYTAKFGLLNWCGRTSLRETIALMRRMDLVITLDTGAAHLAALAGTPRLIVLYGPTNQEKWRPLVRKGVYLEQVFREDLACRPCLARTCPGRACLRELMPERMMAAVRRAFEALPPEQ
jgi:ADP-heptose:LPS heptosyltransferase